MMSQKQNTVKKSASSDMPQTLLADVEFHFNASMKPGVSKPLDGIVQLILYMPSIITSELVIMFSKLQYGEQEMPLCR